MATYDELQEASVILGAAGLAGTGVSEGQLNSILNDIAELKAIAMPPGRAIVNGLYYGPMTTIDGFGGLNDQTMGADTLVCSPFVVYQNASFNELSLEITTAVADSSIRIGLYNVGADGLPTTLWAELGVIDTTATGFRGIAISRVIPRGTYWIGGACNKAGVYARALTITPGMTAFMGHYSRDASSPMAGIYKALSAGFTSLPANFGAIGLTYQVFAYQMRAGA